MVESGLYLAGLLQYILGSFEDARNRALAAGTEKRVRNIIGSGINSRIQQLHYYLPHEGLQVMWNLVKNRLNLHGFMDLGNLVILLNGKNLKTMFRSTNLSDLVQQFRATWEMSLDSGELYANKTWLDIGKEIVNDMIHTRYNVDIQNTSQPFLWKKCCLEKF